MSLIKKIRIKNFKSLEDVEIEIKPLTFLFGPNSSGKSSFLKAMMFLSKNLFPLNTGKTIYNISDDVDLGSYKEIVTNGEISKNVSIEIELEGTFLFPKKELVLLADYSKINLKKSDLFDNLWEETNIFDKLSKLNKHSFLDVIQDIILNIDMNYGEEMNVAVYKKLLNKNLLKANLIVEFNNDDSIKIRVEESIQNSFMKYPDYMGVRNDKLITNNKLITYLFEGYFKFPFESNFQYPTNFPTKYRFLNNSINEIRSSYLIFYPYDDDALKEWESFDFKKKANVYFELLKFMHMFYRVIPNNLFRFLLIKHLPLTRINPKSKYIKENNEFSSDDYYGVLDILKAEQNKIVDDTVTNDENAISKTQIENLTQAYSIKRSMMTGEVHKNIYKMSNYYLNLLFKLNYFLKCNDEVGRIFTISVNNTISNISASSSGFIQLFPIILFCNLLNKNNFMFLKFGKKSFDIDYHYFLDRFFIFADNMEINDLVLNYDNYTTKNLGHEICNKNFAQLYIEQPELHLHPKLQSQLAELFTDTIKDANKECLITIETHSEHLIRKIQVLIAKGELDKEKVGVWYFDNNEGTTKIKEMIIEPNGFFKEPWPNGFFDDSANLSWELLTANKN